MITSVHPELFRVLSGKNALLYEKIIISLYDESYRGTSGESVINRAYVRDMILREMQNYNWQSEDDDNPVNDESIRASQIISRLVEKGWIETKFDTLEMDNIYSFTRIGRKMAQAFYQINSRHLSTRHRNVRSTIKSLQEYQNNLNPYDLIDAQESSDYIISDLMDQINEIHESRKNMVKQAMVNVEEASQGFFDFIEKDFRSSIAISLTEDSATRYNNKIHATIDAILADDKNMLIRNKLMKEKYPNCNDDHSPVEDYLFQISKRIQTASDIKIPELISAIDSYLKNSEMVLKQAGAIVAKRTSLANNLAVRIKSAQTPIKDTLLKQFANALNTMSIKMLDSQKIIIRQRKKRKKIYSVIATNKQISPEQKRERKIKSAIRKHMGYTNTEVEMYIDRYLQGSPSAISAFMPIENYKDLLKSLHSPSVAMKLKDYKVTKTGKRVSNEYYETDEYLIEKKSANEFK